MLAYDLLAMVLYLCMYAASQAILWMEGAWGASTVKGQIIQ